MTNVNFEELKVGYKKVISEIIERRLKDGFTIEEIKVQLITGENIGISGLHQKIEYLNNPQLSETEKQITKDEIEAIKELLNKYYNLSIEKTPEEKNYNKICSFIIGKYGDKEKLFYLDDLIKELKKFFKLTQKEFKEIVLNKLINEKKINLIKIGLMGHKYLRFYKNGIHYSVDTFRIPEKVFKGTFKYN